MHTKRLVYTQSQHHQHKVTKSLYLSSQLHSEILPTTHTAKIHKCLQDRLFKKINTDSCLSSRVVSVLDSGAEQGLGSNRSSDAVG